MFRTSNVVASVFVLCLIPVFSQAGPQSKAKAKSGSADDVPTWEAMKTQIEDQWKTSYPREKILNIEKKGGPEFTQEAGKTETIWDGNWTIIVPIKGREGSYCRQTALVTVERANKTRARFTVAALYKRVGNQWEFAEVPVSTNVEELASADSPAGPSNEEAVKIFTDAWGKIRPDFEVKSIEVLGKPEFHHSAPRYWLTYKLSLEVTGTKKGERERYGKKFKCEPADYSSVLKWDAQNKVWAADEDMIKNFNESSCDAAD